jgi:UPF0755 protein
MIVIGAIYVGYLLFMPHKLANNKPFTINITKGESVRKIASELEQAKVIANPRIFSLIIRVLNKDRYITAGQYLINRPMSMFEVIRRLTNGKPDHISITIIDGWNFKQIRSYLEGESQIKHITPLMSEAQLLAALKLNYAKMEGLLYPDTYYVAPGQTDLEIMQIAAKRMQDKLAVVWQARESATVYANPYQLLIMASLVQRETSESHDMPAVAAVFNNRLRKHMRLQDDPAVFYGLGNRGVITRADFAIDTPYNTYFMLDCRQRQFVHRRCKQFMPRPSR